MELRRRSIDHHPTPVRSEEQTAELPDHRYLHSFPTRRSSDLCGGRPECAGAPRRHGGGGDQWNFGGGPLIIIPPLSDRKSRRLNSRTTDIYTLSLRDALPISAGADPNVRARLVDMGGMVINGTSAEFH